MHARPVSHDYQSKPSLASPFLALPGKTAADQTPVDVSVEQINAFAKLYPHDVRPVQPLNGRTVKESE